MTPKERCIQIITGATQEVHEENNTSAFSPALKWGEGKSRKILNPFLWKMESETGIQENVVYASEETDLHRNHHTMAVRKHLKMSAEGCSELGN